MTQHFSGAGKLAVLALAVTAALMLPLSASARGWGGHGHHDNYRGGYSGAYYGGHGYGHGDYDRGGHWSGGRWIAGALVAGAVIGLIDSVTRPAPVYYEQPMYRQPRTVVYESYGPPVVERRVIERRRVVYDDPYATRYVRSDDDDGD